ncbi:cyclin9 [Zea mays]|uniref:Cyclin9 n=1 Tax=Zea mays TaxID=4577 RepID=A0A1D6GW51_MAIZE|nr:cyclin9 [Zea mays]
MASELMRRPSPNYMEGLQRDITKGMREILIDWLVEVSEEYKLVPDTLYLTVYLIDRFLSRNYIERQRLQLVGITSMLVASKYEEICAPRVEEFCFITDNTYTKAEVLVSCEVEGNLGSPWESFGALWLPADRHPTIHVFNGLALARSGSVNNVLTVDGSLPGAEQRWLCGQSRSSRKSQSPSIRERSQRDPYYIYERAH